MAFMSCTVLALCANYALRRTVRSSLKKAFSDWRVYFQQDFFSSFFSVTVYVLLGEALPIRPM